MRILRLVALALAPLLILSSAAKGADKFDPAALSAAVAPYLDDQAVVVAHVDPTRISPTAAIDKIAQVMNLTGEQKVEAASSAKQAEDLLAQYAKLGGRDVFWVLSLADVPRSPPFLIALVGDGGDPQALARMLRGGSPEERDIPDRRGSPFEATEPLGKVVYAGSKGALARIKTLRAAPRPDLTKAFEAAGDSAVQIVFVPTPDNRRVIREMLPMLPAEIGGVSGGALADGVQWAAVGLNGPPKISLNVTIQSKDAETAAALAKVVASAYALAGKTPEIRQFAPKFDELVKLATPTVKGDRLTLSINDENGGVTQLTEALTQPVNVAREAARRAQSTNNLKQLALAFHNYADSYRKFPTAANYSKEGKPLLSWRVHFLPFLDQAPLYEEFHLDEPWDSEHNRKLIDKMPKAFASPLADLKEPGKTVYLAPVSEGTIFAGTKARTFANITDGTSNTILFVEVAPEKAVVWTRPDDLEVDLEKPLAGLLTPDAKGFLVAFCDGSVRFISAKVDLKVLKAIFTIAGGEPVDTGKL